LEIRISGQAEQAELRKQYSIILQKTLALDGSPVATAIVSEPVEGLGNRRRKITACMMVQIACRGTSCYSSGRDLLCGAGANLGLTGSSMKGLDKFLVHQEKLFKSRETARRFIDSIVERAPKKGNYLAFSPLEHTNFIPDVVLFIARPETVSRIIFLDAYQTGDFETLHGEPLCSGAIAAPISSGKIGISFLDMACRRFGRYRPEEMVIGVPYIRLPHIIESIELSSAGTANPACLLTLAGTWLRMRMPAD